MGFGSRSYDSINICLLQNPRFYMGRDDLNISYSPVRNLKAKIND